MESGPEINGTPDRLTAWLRCPGGEPELEQEFRREFYARSVRPQRAMTVIGFVLYLVFALLYTFVFGEDYFGVRYTNLTWICPGLAWLFTMTYTKPFVRRNSLLMVLGCLAVFVPISALYMRTAPPGYDLTLRPSVVLTILCFYTAIHLRYAAATVLGVGYSVATLGSCAWHGYWHGSSLASMAAMAVAANAIGVFVAYQLESNARRDFAQRRQVAGEREKSEKLLLNILPEAIATRLKEGDGTIADHFEEVTVLFADLVGFTEMSASIPPAELVALLNEVFSRFDGLADRFGVEKIKTIGDAYMVVAGLPNRRTDHAEAVASMALAMLAAIAALNRQHGIALAVRIGINTGPVVAGVIGRKRLIYDLWGDTVNIASRMESHGDPGGIQITESTRQALEGLFSFECRGLVPIKGKGELMTYWLLEPRRAAA